MKHVYLSPHLDDAVLSCGGAIHRRAATGETVLVLTIFTGDFEGGELSPFAARLHKEWGNPPQIMTLRCAEDVAALTLLGAQGQHLGYLDAIYRADPEGEWLYTGDEALFGGVHLADPLIQDGAEALFADLVERLPPAEQATVYAPLTVGQHVDHVVVHSVARHLLESGYRVAFYEDYPYAETPQALESALVAVEGEHWRSEVIPLDPADVAARVSAIGYYRSQLSILFGGAEAMPNRVWAYAAACSVGPGLAERIWWPELASPA